MSFLSKTVQFLGFGVEAEASSLAPVPLPKAPTGQQAEPAFRTIVGGTASLLRKQERSLLTTDRLSVRNSRDTFSAIRTLSYSSPDLSAAIFATLRTGIPDKYTLVARDMDGRISPTATALSHELLRRLTYLGNVDGSYGPQCSLQSLSESLGRELLLYGAAAVEVALDKARIPASLNPISIYTIKWYDEEKALRPVQIVGGEEINLDIPTFIYTSLDQDLLDSYSNSPYEAAQQPVLADSDFTNDVRRAMKRSVLPRLVATIDSEAVLKATPPEIRQDPAKFANYKQALVDGVQSIINNAAAEDCLVSFSEVSYAYIDGGKDPSAIIENMQSVLNAKLQTGAKTLPTVLGHGAGANASSSEALLFVKSSNVIRVKLNELYSRALTIAIRLMGEDCYCEFEYDPIDLRPDSELEAFKSMKQSRILEQLSLGLISDEEACIKLTGNLPPAGYKPLMGTMFKAGAAAPNAQPGTAASGTSAMDKTLNTGTPKNPKAETSLLADAHRESMEALHNVVKSMQRDTAPVAVSVAPSELHLTIASEAAKPAKTIKIVRDANGRFEGMEVSE